MNFFSVLGINYALICSYIYYVQIFNHFYAFKCRPFQWCSDMDWCIRY